MTRGSGRRVVLSRLPDGLIVFPFELLILLITMFSTLQLFLQLPNTAEGRLAYTVHPDLVFYTLGAVFLMATILITHGVWWNSLSSRSTGLLLGALACFLYATLKWWAWGLGGDMWVSVVLFYGDSLAALIRGLVGQTVLEIEREADDIIKRRSRGLGSAHGYDQ